MSCDNPGDLKIWRGNNVPRVWRFKDADGNLNDLTGWVFVLTITRQPGQPPLITKTSGVDSSFAVDIPAATVTWNITAAESRLIPLGRLATYELESRVAGIQRTLISAGVIGLGGDNSD